LTSQFPEAKWAAIDEFLRGSSAALSFACWHGPMRPWLKRRLAVGAAGLAVLAAAGGTYAATRGSGDDERQAFLNDVAKRLNVSPDRLESALRGAFSDRLDAAVREGRLTRREADEIERRASEHGGLPLLGGPPPPGHSFRRGERPRGLHFMRPGPPLLGALHAAARYLGLSDAALRDRLASGRSLAQVARARGKSVDGLEEALKRATRERLDRAVARGRLTKAEERDILRQLDERLDFLVRLSGPRPGPPPPLPGG
jgi:hypothetical protein